MSILDSITSQQECDEAAWLFRESIDRGFGWLSELLYQNDGGVSTPADLRHFGNLAEEIRQSGVNEERQGERLGTLAVCAADYFSVRGSNGAHPDKPLVDDLFKLSDRRRYRRQGWHIVESQETWAFCAVVGVASLGLAMGITRREIDENPQLLAALAHKYTSDVGRPVDFETITHTLRSFARWGSVCDWISSKRVERMKESLGNGRLIVQRTDGEWRFVHR